MNINQKERLLDLIRELRKTTFPDRGDFPEEAEVNLYILHGQLEKLKMYTKRIEDEFIREQISELDINFDFIDQQEVIRVFNKAQSLFGEIEDFLLQDNYESIANFAHYDNTSESTSDKIEYSQRLPNAEDIKQIKKAISKAELDEAIEKLDFALTERGMSTDNLLLIQGRLSLIKDEYERGTILFDEFSKCYVLILVSITKELNKIIES